MSTPRTQVLISKHHSAIKGNKKGWGQKNIFANYWPEFPKFCTNNSTLTEKGESFQQIGTGIIEHPYAKKINFELYFVPFTKIKPKWIIDLNVEHKSIKYQKENIGYNACDLWSGKNFLDMNSKVCP